MNDFVMFAGGARCLRCPANLPEAAALARSGAKARPGVEYRVELNGALRARYVLRGGRLEVEIP